MIIAVTASCVEHRKATTEVRGEHETHKFLNAKFKLERLRRVDSGWTSIFINSVHQSTDHQPVTDIGQSSAQGCVWLAT